MYSCIQGKIPISIHSTARVETLEYVKVGWNKFISIHSTARVETEGTPLLYAGL